MAITKSYSPRATLPLEVCCVVSSLRNAGNTLHFKKHQMQIIKLIYGVLPLVCVVQLFQALCLKYYACLKVDERLLDSDLKTYMMMLQL